MPDQPPVPLLSVSASQRASALGAELSVASLKTPVAPTVERTDRALDEDAAYSSAGGWRRRSGRASRSEAARPARGKRWRRRRTPPVRVSSGVAHALALALALVLAGLTLHAPRETRVSRQPVAPIAATAVAPANTIVQQAGVGGAQAPVLDGTPSATPPSSSTTSSSTTSPPTPLPAATSATPQTTATSVPGWGLGLPDPSQWVQQVLAAALTAFFSGVLTALSAILGWAQGIGDVGDVGSSAFNFVTRTPSEGTYGSSSVITLWRWVVGVADAALAVFVLWGGYATMSREALGSSAPGAMRLLPRLGLAALAANLSLLFVGGFIDLGNALCDGVGQVGLPGYDVATSGQQNLAALVLAVVYCVVGFLLIAQMLLRLALLDVLIVTAPLGFLCWALPQTQAWARLWTSTFVATVLVQFLQILALRLGALLVNELTPGRLDSATLTVLTGIATLYLTFKLPGMLQNGALRSIGSANMGGVVEGGMAILQAAGAAAAALL